MKKVMLNRFHQLVGLMIGLTVCGYGLSTQVRADENSVGDYVFDKTVEIVFSNSSATVTNGDVANVEVTQSGCDFVVASEAEGVEVILSGKGDAGSVEVDCTEPVKITLNGLDLRGTSVAPVESLSTNRVFVVLATGTENVLQEGSTSNTSKGILAAAGPLIVSGTGSLEFVGELKRHAIYGAGDVYIKGGDILVTSSQNDGVHTTGSFQMDNGTLRIPGAVGDGVDSEGNITLNGGSLTYETAVEDVKGLKCNGSVYMNGGLLNMSISGQKSKGVKCTDVEIRGGTMFFDLSANVLLETVQTTTTNASGTITTNSYISPSYCTAIKCSGNATVRDGCVTVTHTGTAGKGISSDGDFVMSGGALDFYLTGSASSTYKNSSSTTDIAAADCLNAAGNMTITGGTVKAITTGSAGDAISCDGVLVIGVSGVEDTPVITAATKGQKVAVSGSGNNAEYANPKGLTSAGNMTINGGTITISTQYDGGEGIESKKNLVINGGVLDVQAYDDCINASSSIVINGGSIYCYSSGNDAIDANGTMTITGGLIIASGTTAPEEGFDCDQNTFKITGGVLIGTGGASSTPTSAQCTQRSIVYSGTGTAGLTFQIKSSSGDILVYTIPRSYATGGGGFFAGPGGGGPGGGGGGQGSGAMTFLFSSPDLTSNVTYSIVTGGTISGGTSFHGYYTGATVTGGTTVKSFTPSSMVTAVQ